MEQKSSALRAFAARRPFLFALVFFVVSFCLVLVDLFVLPPLWGDQVVQSGLSIGVLAWLGWLHLAGFNSPSQWRSLSLLWLPGLLALGSLSLFLLTLRVSGASVVVLAVLFALLNGLSEEARFRGVILQALLPYGWLRAAALSALFFGLAHLINLLIYPPLIAFGYVFDGFLFGFGYAAFRLRTNTIWPLIIFHACRDLIPVSTVLNGGRVPALYGNSLFVIASFFFDLLLAGYGLLLLRPWRQQQVETLAEE